MMNGCYDKCCTLAWCFQLELKGLTIDEKDNTSSDPFFLEWVMSINEEIHDDPDPARLREIRTENNSEFC